MNEIVKFEPKIKIWFWDIGNEYTFVISKEENRLQIEDSLANDKIIKIENITFSTSRFIKIEPLWKVWNIQDFIFSQKPEIRKIIKKREKDKWEKINCWFSSIEEIKNYLKSKNINLND